MSRLRARCPACRTLTAVAVGPDYECHACGRVFAAGLVRVPRAWGIGGEPMAAAASLALPYPEAAVVKAPSLEAQTRAVAADLPERPLVLGGCCCAHLGAVRALAARHERLAVVWLDAHGDLNTPETSPSGDPWGMPLRMLLDDGVVAPGDVALVGARNLDPPESELIVRTGLHTGGAAALARALNGADGAYVALDGDVLDEREISAFMPEPGGLRVEDVAGLLADTAGRTHVAGAGVSGLRPDPRNLEPVVRLLGAMGL